VICSSRQRPLDADTLRDLPLAERPRKGTNVREGNCWFQISVRTSVVVFDHTGSCSAVFIPLSSSSLITIIQSSLPQPSTNSEVRVFELAAVEPAGQIARSGL